MNFKAKIVKFLWKEFRIVRYKCPVQTTYTLEYRFVNLRWLGWFKVCKDLGHAIVEVSHSTEHTAKQHLQELVEGQEYRYSVLKSTREVITK